MYGRAALLMVAATSCSHAGSARAESVECRGAPNAKPIAGLDIEQACALVRDRVQSRISGDPRPAILIELDLSRPWSAVARIGGHPEIAIDVMDRPLNRDDLIRLADAIAAASGAPRGR